MCHIVKESIVDCDVGEAEIGSLREKRLTGGFGEGIGETVAKIERRRVPAFSIFAPRGAGEVGLFGVYGNDLETGPNNEQVKFTACGLALPSFENDSSFEYSRGGY
jgi:hypothetical protein